MAQQTFLGASISSFSCSLGWGAQTSTLTVQLVEDDVQGDAFFAVAGAPAFFEYGDFFFYGIIQSYSVKGDPSGFPIYEVILADPRDLLNGAQLVLNNYSGNTDLVPNVLNVYGAYIDSDGFGGSRVNEGGTPWRLVQDAIHVLTDDTNDEGYGDALAYNGYRYSVDLRDLPNLNNDFRVGAGATHMSIMDFVVEVCEAASHDYFFTLTFVNGRNTITITTVDRSDQPQFGAISQFILNTPGAKSLDTGFEYRADANNVFLLGGSQETNFLVQQDQGAQNTLTDDVIMPFYGLDANGNVIIGRGDPFTDDYNFDVDARAVNVLGVGNTYTISVAEMRAALISDVEWTDFLIMENDDDESVHKGVADDLDLDTSGVNSSINKLFTDDPVDWDNFPVHKLFPTLKNQIQIAGRDSESFHEENIQTLYKFVLNYAQQYFGKQYMIRIPFMDTSRDDETGIITSSRVPSDGGYATTDGIRDAISAGFLPSNYDNLTLEDGRIVCYCGYYNANRYFYDDLRPDEDVIENNTIYLKSTVLPEIVYLDQETLFSPRVVVSVPSFIEPQYQRSLDSDQVADRFTAKFTKSSYGLMRRMMEKHVKIHGGDVQENMDKLLSTPMNELVSKGMAGNAPPPDFFVVPLRSTIETYGPYYWVGALGGTKVEQDTSLVPWNYASFDVMENVAYAKVSEGATFQTLSEAGSIEFPGFPSNTLGSQLISGGPYITDINVSITNNEATTRYSMSTWTPRFGSLDKAMSDKIDRITQKNLQLEKEARQASRLANNVTARLSIFQAKPKALSKPKKNK